MAWAAKSGRKVAFQVAFSLNFIACVFFFIGFVTPYWVQSWPRIYSGFQKIGLWEACFQGLVLPFDPRLRSYYGCWWIFAPEFEDMREFLMPWWFILTQLICVLVLILLVIALTLHFALWLIGARKNNVGVKSREPITVVQALTVITIINAIAMTFTVILFGLAYYLDRDWMPYRQLNYLSWSYGLTIVSTLFMIFASIALLVYNRLVRKEYREPGTMRTPLTGSSPESPPYPEPPKPLAYPKPQYPAYPAGGSTSHPSVSTSSYSGGGAFKAAPVAYPGGSQSGYSGGYSGASVSGYPGGSTNGSHSASQSGYPYSQGSHHGSGQLYPAGSQI